MTTGYTSCIEEGATFEEFALKCARAFGVLSYLKDVGLDEKIPKEIKPDITLKECIKELERELEKAGKMSLEEAEERAKGKYIGDKEWEERWASKNKNIKEKYEKMLKRVEAWEPPTKDHKGLKKFMIDQIRGSIKSDCRYSPVRVIKETPEEWLRDHIESVEDVLKSSKKHWREEVKRCKEATEWLKQLRKSLEDSK